MATSREKVKQWVVDYQYQVAVDRYEDIQGGEDLRIFFEKYLYPSYQDRKEYERRNEFFRTIVSLYSKGKIGKIFGGAIILFTPLLNIISEKMKELPHYLQILIELYDLTNILDDRLIGVLHQMVNGDENLNEENYIKAYRKSSTYGERKKQVDYVVSLGEYAMEIVQKAGRVDFLVEKCPQIPFFTKNKYIKDLNETILLIKAAYHAFKHSKNKLNYIRDMVKEREYEYINSIFK